MGTEGVFVMEYLIEVLRDLWIQVPGPDPPGPTREKDLPGPLGPLCPTLRSICRTRTTSTGETTYTGCSDETYQDGTPPGPPNGRDQW